MATDDSYREGDQHPAAGVPLPPDPPPAEPEETPAQSGDVTPAANAETPEVPTEPGRRIPEMAVLLVRHEDGSHEAVTQLPGMEVKRTATLHDVRNMAQAVAADVVVRQTAQQAAQLISGSLGKAMTQIQVERMRGQLSGSKQG